MDGAEDGESHCDETHVDDDCKVKCAFVNPSRASEFGKAEIGNEHMHARISYHSVDAHYFDVMCGFIFETRIYYGNIVHFVFDEALKVEVAFVAARYEIVETAHKAVHDLAAANEQEEDKVIEEFLMRIYTTT